MSTFELIQTIPDKTTKIALALEVIIELAGKWQVTKNQQKILF